MHFPKYWSKGTEDNYTCWRWSDVSLADAAQLAQVAVRELARLMSAGIPPKNTYAYFDRPMREPVLQELRGSAGAVSAVVTRNSYGCLVLNTSSVMFVDVDLPETPVSIGSWFKKLFGKQEASGTGDAESRVLAQAEAWIEANPGWGWRIYRTSAGLRLMATHALIEPGHESARRVFDAMGADPLYRRLCDVQQCYRARLTPKPWRCRVPKPPVSWPWPDDNAEARYVRWDDGYRQACERFATCDLVTTLGNDLIHSDVRPILELHDEMTRVDSRLPLA